jgi:hypothetical protein
MQISCGHSAQLQQTAACYKVNSSMIVIVGVLVRTACYYTTVHTYLSHR